MDVSKYAVPKRADFRGYRTFGELAKEVQDGLPDMDGWNDPAKARKMARDKIPKESYYQRKIMEALRDAFPTGRWRKNAAGIGQDAGEPDLIGCLDGRFIAIEVKRPLVGEPTALQEKAVREIRAAGGCAMFASYPDEVVAAVGRYMEFLPYWYEVTGSWASEVINQSD